MMSLATATSPPMTAPIAATTGPILARMPPSPESSLPIGPPPSFAWAVSPALCVASPIRLMSPAMDLRSLEVMSENACPMDSPNSSAFLAVKIPPTSPPRACTAFPLRESKASSFLATSSLMAICFFAFSSMAVVRARDVSSRCFSSSLCVVAATRSAARLVRWLSSLRR